MSNTEDDWESTDLNLKSLNVNDEAKQTSSSGVVIPNRLMNKPLVNEINFFQDQQHQQPLSTATPKRSTTSGKVLNLPIIDEPIDHNLIEALQKPTERTNALKIEQTIYNFVYSEDEHLEFLPGCYNSYRRMLAYRIGQRFRLNHETIRDHQSNNPEKGIVFFRGPSICVPRFMLADLKFDPVPMPAYYPPYGGVPMLSVMDPGQMLAAQQQQGASMGLPPSSPSSGGSKTFQVMKRQNSSKFDNHNSHTHNRDTANGGNRKPQVSGVEKEKIYAAYKAHLFNEEGLATSSSAGSLTIESQPSGDKFDGKVRSGSQTTDLSGALPGLPDGDSVNDGIAARSGSLDNTADLTSPFTEGVDEGVSSGNERERTGVQESNESSPRTQNTGSSRGNRYGGHHAASLQALPSSENGAHFVYDKKGQMTPNRVAGSSGKSFYASNHGGSNKSLYSGSSPDRRYSNMPLSREVSTEALSNSNGPYNSFNTVPDSPNPSTKASSTYSRGKKPPDVNNWKEPKYTPRDKDAERSDPDFTRRNVPMPQPIAFTGPQMLPLAMMAGGQYPPRYPDGSNMVAPGGMYPMPVPYPMQQMPGMYPVQYMQGQGQWMPTPYYPPGAPMMGVSAPGQVYPGQPVYDYGQQQVIYTPYPAQQQQYQHQQQTQQQQPSQQQIPSSPPPRTLRDSRGSNGNGHRDNSNSQVRQNYNGNSNGNVSTNA